MLFGGLILQQIPVEKARVPSKKVCFTPPAYSPNIWPLGWCFIKQDSWTGYYAIVFWLAQGYKLCLFCVWGKRKNKVSISSPRLLKRPLPDTRCQLKWMETSYTHWLYRMMADRKRDSYNWDNSHKTTKWRISYSCVCVCSVRSSSLWLHEL